MPQTTSNMNDTQPQLPSPEEEARNRKFANALLALRHQTLMALLKNLPEDFPERLDYGNASSWLRGVPGRFGVIKQRALLSLIGYEHGHLRTDITHAWFPPRPHRKMSADSRSNDEDVSKFIAEFTSGDAPLRRRRVTTPEKAPLGWALDLRGATVLLPINNGVSETEITKWLASQGLDKASTLCTETSLPKETWLEYINGKPIEFGIWNTYVKNVITQPWDEVIKEAKSRGLQPGDVLALVRKINIKNYQSILDQIERYELFYPQK